MLELIPTGGLCNKMRAIDSAISFCDTYNIPLKVYWIKDERRINCEFKDIFLPIKGLRLEERKDLPFKLQKGSWNNLYIPNLLRKLPNARKIFGRFEIKKLKNGGEDFKELYDKYKHLVFFTFSCFFNNKTNYEIFKPKPLIQEMIEKEIRTFDEFTIGIHIRRTDHKIAIKNSPIEFFEKEIEKEILKDNRVNFYLASDCLDTKKYLMGKYGSVIKTDLRPGDRTTLEGMYRGVTELYALSKTKKIYCSFGSSYSETACLIGDIKRIQLI